MTVIVTGAVLLTLNICWNFVLGVAGVWNFGQLAIYALGVRGGPADAARAWLPPAGGPRLAACARPRSRSLLAFPTLRLFGIYTSLLTFAFSEVVQYVILDDGCGLTGGPFGFPTVPGLYPELGPDALSARVLLDALGVAVVASCCRPGRGHSPLGIALRSVRDAPAYAAARGASPLAARVMAFAISGFLASIAGGLYICFQPVIHRQSVGLTPMTIDVTMLVIGGLGTIFGPMIGTALAHNHADGAGGPPGDRS